VTSPQIRVLVVEDDPDTAEYTRTVLTRRGGMDVHLVTDPHDALAHARLGELDVVITDIELPGMSGLQLVTELRASAPWLPVVVMTAHASVDYAVDALRRDAEEFLVKPVPAATLVERVTELALRGRRLRDQQRDAGVVLAVGAHPDDVEIGAGAILASHRAAGDTVVILTLSGGEAGGAAPEREHEALAAAEVIGARLFLLGFTDTAMVADGVLVRAIEETIAQVRPTIVYTHSVHDRHQDHRAVFQAVEVAARQVPALASYQSPSSTVDFRPNRFVPVDDHLETKLTMLAAFRSQAHRDYMQPDLVRATARYWSRFGGARFVEPLEVIRANVMLAAAPGHVEESRSAPTELSMPEHGGTE